MYIRRSEDVLCTFNLHPVYRGIFNYYNASSEVMLNSNIHKPLKQISKFEELVKYLPYTLHYAITVFFFVCLFFVVFWGVFLVEESPCLNLTKKAGFSCFYTMTQARNQEFFRAGEVS